MADFISREAAIAKIKNGQCRKCSDIGLCGNCAVLIALKILDTIPAADVRENVPGEWKYVEGGELATDGYYCTACGKGFHVHVPYFAEFNFCPNCGAVMRREAKQCR